MFSTDLTGGIYLLVVSLLVLPFCLYLLGKLFKFEATSLKFTTCIWTLFIASLVGGMLAGILVYLVPSLVLYESYIMSIAVGVLLAFLIKKQFKVLYPKAIAVAVILILLSLAISYVKVTFFKSELERMIDEATKINTEIQIEEKNDVTAQKKNCSFINQKTIGKFNQKDLNFTEEKESSSIKDCIFNPEGSNENIQILRFVIRTTEPSQSLASLEESFTDSQKFREGIGYESISGVGTKAFLSKLDNTILVKAWDGKRIYTASMSAKNKTESFKEALVEAVKEMLLTE